MGPRRVVVIADTGPIVDALVVELSLPLSARTWKPKGVFNEDQLGSMRQWIAQHAQTVVTSSGVTAEVFRHLQTNWLPADKSIYSRATEFIAQLIDEERNASIHDVSRGQQPALSDLGIVDAGLLLIAANAALAGELPVLLTDDGPLRAACARIEGVRAMTSPEMWADEP